MEERGYIKNTSSKTKIEWNLLTHSFVIGVRKQKEEISNH